MLPNDDKQDGHSREWQDRARIVIDAKKDAQTEASPNQSPLEQPDGSTPDSFEDVEEKSDAVKRDYNHAGENNNKSSY